METSVRWPTEDELNKALTIGAIGLLVVYFSLVVTFAVKVIRNG